MYILYMCVYVCVSASEAGCGPQGFRPKLIQTESYVLGNSRISMGPSIEGIGFDRRSGPFHSASSLSSDL